MLPHVSSVLRRFLSPIAEIGHASGVSIQIGGNPSPHEHPRDDRPHAEAQTDSEQKESEPEGTEPLPGVTQPKQPKLTLVEASPPTPPSLSDLPTILQLFELVKSHQALILRWIGVRSYRTAAADQKKASHFEKGTILDQRAG